MSKIYITGHQNPDMDSITAAYALANLKNKVDKDNEYIPVALGPLNSSCKALFTKLNINPPVVIKDIFTRVDSIIRRPTLVLSSDEAVIQLVNMYNQSNPSVVPIMDDDEFKGLLSIDDINRYFLLENLSLRPIYDFKVSNFPKVLHGFFLKKAKIETFRASLMVGAMRFDVFTHRLEKCEGKPLLIVGCRKNHIEHAIKAQLPGIILTGVEESSLEDIDFSSFNGFVYVSNEDTAETIRLLRLSIPVIDILSKEKMPLIKESMLFDVAKDILADSNQRGLPVFDEDDKFKGFITRRCFLDKPRTKIILVDHNEARQSVKGLDDAEIIEIVDHHRLDAPKTRNPISIISAPVGSTCTIIFDMYKRSGIEISKEIATILLAGITSDTVILKSPTTTSLDHHAKEELLKIVDLDYEEFAASIFNKGAVLSSQDPHKAIRADFKAYFEKGVSFGIGQVEVSSVNDLNDIKQSYIQALELKAHSERLDWAMLLVTDVFKQSSILITTDYKKTYRFIYEKLENNIYYLPGVLSRKKQLIPEVIRVLESN